MNEVPREDVTSFGPNAGLVDEMYERYRADPDSVSESWRDFFSDYDGAAKTPVASPAEPVAEATPESEPDPEPRPAPVENGAQALKGAAARVVSNMTASLGVPTATS